MAIIVIYGVDDIMSMNRSYSELLMMFENVYKHIEKSILQWTWGRKHQN